MSDTLDTHFAALADVGVCPRCTGLGKLGRRGGLEVCPECDGSGQWPKPDELTGLAEGCATLVHFDADGHELQQRAFVVFLGLACGWAWELCPFCEVWGLFHSETSRAVHWASHSGPRPNGL